MLLTDMMSLKYIMSSGNSNFMHDHGLHTWRVLADNVFEPAMSSGGSLNRTFGWLVGTGSGSGMALMFLMTGTLGTILCLGGYAFKELRNLEVNLPDYDMAGAEIGE